MPVYDRKISICDIFLEIYIDISDLFVYNKCMIIKNLLLSSESYTHQNWEFRNVNVGFSRLYYIIDGEAYYEENGQAVRFKKNHIYLTPVKQSFNLYENPNDKLLHTYVHITTHPVVTHFTEIKVKQGTPLADAVALWRKYAHSSDYKLVADIIQLVLSRINEQYSPTNAAAQNVKHYIDALGAAPFNMSMLSKKFGYSREHITRIFHSTYRVTPMQYYNTRRMNLALEKLLKGETVTNIASEFNFASPYSFSKAFKSHFGSSPLRYVSELSTNTVSDAQKKS